MPELLDTPRLRLVRLTADEARALVNGHRPPGARWAPGYPTDGALVGAGAIVTADAEGRAPDTVVSFRIVRRDDDCVIGGCGFLHLPEEPGTVGVSWSLADSVDDDGYGAEALRALVDALHGAGVKRILAEAAGRNVERTAVLSEAGFEAVAMEGEVVVFEA